METVQGIAEAILRARASATPVPADSVRVDAEVAYDVQDAVTASRLSAGERVVGWKLGYVSEIMREALGIQEPNAGPLTDAMVFTSPGHLTSGGLQPRVEPEIAVTLDADWFHRGPLAGGRGGRLGLDGLPVRLGSQHRGWLVGLGSRAGVVSRGDGLAGRR